MQRFFVEPYQIQEKDNKIIITGNDVNHIKNVLRMKNGEEIWVSDSNNHEYHCRIDGIEAEKIDLHILYMQEADYELPGKIYLFQGLPKGDKMELIIQKAVELGVHEIIPVEMKRCVVRLDEKKAQKKRERWQQIAESAAKQSKRMLIPQIHPVINYSQAIAYAKEMDICLLPYEMAKGMKETKQIISKIQPGKTIGVFIGPEGGFEEKEVEEALEIGAKTITLGRRILRTETAGLTILSILMFHLENEETGEN